MITFPLISSHDSISSTRFNPGGESRGEGVPTDSPVDTYTPSLLPALLAPRPQDMLLLVYGGGMEMSPEEKGSKKGEEKWHHLVRALESVPPWVLRAGGRLLVPALRQAGVEPRPSLFPELQPHRDHRSSRVIINSSPSEPDMTNRGHMLFSDVYPHGRTNLRAGSVNSALRQTLDGLPGGEELHEVNFYGHGRPGGMQVGDEWLTSAHLDPATPEGQASLPLLRQVRDRLAPGAVIYLRGCECLKGEEGAAFGQRLADFFGRPVVGHTEVMGGLDRPGEVTIRPRPR